MIIEIANRLKVTDLPNELYNSLIGRLKFTNPKWLENHRMGRWNKGVPKELVFYDKIGKKSLILPRGYIRQLIYLCRRHDLKYTIQDERRSLPEVRFTFTGELKPYQNEASSVMLSKDFGILNAATGSGKTVIALFMIAERKQPSLIVVHTKDLAFQWIERISTFLDIPQNEIGFIGGGKYKVSEKITVALVQSLYKRADEVAKQIGFIVIDECHRCPSRTFTEAVTEFDSKYMLGLSATPYRRDKLSKLIFWHLGDTHHEIDKSHLIQKGHILKAEVITRITDFKPFHDPVNFYSKMLSELTTDLERNLLIASDVAIEAKKNEGVCLVLSDRKAHCENLHTLLKLKFKTSSEILTGDLSTAERQTVIEKLVAGQVKVLVATGQLVGEGFDCKELSTLFLATPIRFSGRVLQYIGRVLRPADGKTEAKIFDYEDIHVDVLVAAANARKRVYDGQGI